MNGAPFGALLVFPVVLAVAIILAIGIGIGTVIGKPAEPAERECIVIDMRSHGPPAEPPADITGSRT